MVEHVIEKYFYFKNKNMFFDYVQFLNSKKLPYKVFLTISGVGKLLMIKNAYFDSVITLQNDYDPYFKFTFYRYGKRYQMNYRLSKSNYKMVVKHILSEYNIIVDKPIRLEPDENGYIAL